MPDHLSYSPQQTGGTDGSPVRIGLTGTPVARSSLFVLRSALNQRAATFSNSVVSAGRHDPVNDVGVLLLKRVELSV